MCSGLIAVVAFAHVVCRTLPTGVCASRHCGLLCAPHIVLVVFEFSPRIIICFKFGCNAYVFKTGCCIVAYRDFLPSFYPLRDLSCCMPLPPPISHVISYNMFFSQSNVFAIAAYFIPYANFALTCPFPCTTCDTLDVQLPWSCESWWIPAVGRLISEFTGSRASRMQPQ